MSDIRIASGHVTAQTLLTTDSYLVSNWTMQSDQTSKWVCVQTTPLTRQHRTSLESGAGKFVGGYTCNLDFFVTTPGMRSYLESTLLGGNGIAKVTAYLQDPRSSAQWVVVQGELVSPFVSGGDFDWFSGYSTINPIYTFRRGVVASLNVLASDNAPVLSNGNYVAVSVS